MVFALLSGAPPFETGDVKTTYGRISEGSFALPPGLSVAAADLVVGALALRPEARPTVPALLRHTFTNASSSLHGTIATTSPHAFTLWGDLLRSVP